MLIFIQALQILDTVLIDLPKICISNFNKDAKLNFQVKLQISQFPLSSLVYTFFTNFDSKPNRLRVEGNTHLHTMLYF